MSNRARGYAAIVYPDSAPDNWRELLDQEHIAWVESPFHCFDTEPTGEVKKPHWHIVLTFEGVKTQQQVAKILEPLNCTIPIPLNSVRGMVRYMAHLDNPEKYQYPPEQIIGHGGFDVPEMLRLTASARYSIIGKMTATIKEIGFSNYADFFDYAVAHHQEDWLPLLCDNSSYIISQYIKGCNERNKVGERYD